MGCVQLLSVACSIALLRPLDGIAVFFSAWSKRSTANVCCSQNGSSSVIKAGSKQNRKIRLKFIIVHYFQTIKKFITETGIHRHQTPPGYRTAARPIKAKHDIIHKTGSTQCITTPPEEDRATATGDLQTKFREDWSSGSRDMPVDRETDRHMDRLIAILPSLQGRSNNTVLATLFNFTAIRY